MKRWFAFTTTSLLIMLASVCTARAQSAERLRLIVETISKGANSAERREAITSYLEASGIQFHLENFIDVRKREGANIVARVPGKTSKTILLGAHFDRVEQSQGTIDNAAACAAMLTLIETFKSKPLASRTLEVVFFDLEEVGLRGSEAYFGATRSEPKPEQAINLDIFGYGNSLFATASTEDGPLIAAIRQAAAEAKIPVRLTAPTQYPSSDHANMIKAGIETVGLALIGADEIDGTIDILVNRKPNTPPPLVLTLIHSPRDTPAALRPEEMERAIPILEKAIRLLDEK
jgi:putative aminopeptidase FrvX